MSLLGWPNGAGDGWDMLTPDQQRIVAEAEIASEMANDIRQHDELSPATLRNIARNRGVDVREAIRAAWDLVGDDEYTYGADAVFRKAPR